MSHKKIVGFLLWLFLILLQFYVFRSGTPQPSYIVAAIAMFATAIYPKSWIRYKDGTIACFLFYVGYATTVQLISSLVYQVDDFFGNLLFILFDLGVFLTISTYIVRHQESSKRVISHPLALSLVLLALFYFTGLGRYDFFPRYNGFFNDPNQMAHFALCSLCVVLFVERSVNLVAVVSFLSATVICVASASRSSMLGLALVLIGFVMLMINALKSKKGKPGSARALYGTVLIAIIAALVYIFKDPNRIEAISYMLQRTNEINVSQQAEGRSFLVAFENIEYMFFGAGQGYMERFGVENEIHSDWIGTLFYFGLPGMLGICLFLYRCIKSLPLSLALISFGPLLYGFTTYGMRTPIFYVYIATLYTYYRSQRSAHVSGQVKSHNTHRYKKQVL